MTAASDQLVQAGNKVIIRASTHDDGVLATIHAVHRNRFNQAIRVEVAQPGAKRRVFTYRHANGDYVERDTPTFSGPWLDMIWHPSQRKAT